MKKYFVLSLFAAVAYIGFMSAQANFYLPEGKEVLVYSLPQTELCIEIEIEKITKKPGTFYLYSERYLATQDVVTEESTNFQLKNIRVKSNALPDPSRRYSVVYGKNSPFNSLSVNEKGILCGMNVSCLENIIPDDKGEKINNPKNITKKERNSLLPLTEEYMMAASTSKMAEGAAKTIYRIRENRLNLLTGDVDQLPDGSSLRQMLKKMDMLEKELTELFTGKITTETLTNTIYITPSTEMKDNVLFRISSLKGLVSANDLSGVPYYINVTPETIHVAPSNTKKGTTSELFHILPAKTHISIGDGKNTLFSEMLFMPQLGQSIPFPNELIMKKGVKITIDPETGRLLRIEE